jgi:hypothetical protein
MSSTTIEALERELGEAQAEREARQKAVLRAENAHEAACGARDDAWAESDEGFGTDREVARLSALVYDRRRELYEAIDRLKAAEGRERRIKSRLMYVLPAERRRYLLGLVDEEFEEFLRTVEAVYRGSLPGAWLRVVTEGPGERDLGGDAVWRALERLYAGTVRRWVEIRSGAAPGAEERARAMARLISFYAGGHVPRLFVGGVEVAAGDLCSGAGKVRPLPGFDGPHGRLALARITARRYLDEGSIGRLQKRPAALVEVAEIARLYGAMGLTGDEIRWRLEQLISLRLEVLEAVRDLTGEGRRFSFYEIARAARLLDGHLPDAGIAAEALLRAVEKATESGVPLVDVAYFGITGDER